MLLNRTHNLCSRLIGGFAGVTTRNPGGVCASAPRHAAGVRPAAAVVHHALKWLWMALLIICLSPFQAVSANNVNQFVNWAELQTAELQPIVSTVTVTLQQSRTNSSVDFLKYAPGAPDSVGTSVARTYYKDSTGAFVEVNSPVAAGTGTPIDLSSPVPLLKTGLFHAGEPVFVRITDSDQNVSNTVAETIIVTIADPKTGDAEILRLTESGPDTGIFSGYIQTVKTSAAAINNGFLSVSEASSLEASYVDVVDETDSSVDAALVDPFGIVFDSITGKPVDGATVELLNADGSAAAVFGDNGLLSNTYPNSIVSGSTAIDKEGNMYSFPPGGYRFPYVNPNNYYLKVTPPTSHNAPSKAATSAIQALSGAPFAILEPGSRGEVFPVAAGPAIRVDIPLDPKEGTFWLSKTSGKSSASVGEHLSYNLTLENNSPGRTVVAPVITDKLPHGFRYAKGSAVINGAPASDPAISADGSTMSFTLADIPPSTTITLQYVVTVGAGAQTGTATNTAVAHAASSVTSNIAKASVLVQEPFMMSRNIIMGRVVVGACGEDNNDNKRGMAGIGIYLEDGTFVISDKIGMFHFEGIASGTHVVQLDLDSIPEGYKILPCEQNSRFAGRAYSQFVEMQGGTLWRTDFYLGKIESVTPPPSAEKDVSVEDDNPAYKGEIALEMISEQDGDFINYQILLQADAIPLHNVRMKVTLPPGADYIKGSSNFDGATITDPDVIADRVLSYRLGAAGTDWRKVLLFKVKIDRRTKGGELQTTADLTFDSPTTEGIAAPPVDNLLSVVKEESRFLLPTMIVRPQFPTFGADLSEADRRQLDEVALVLKRFKIDHIDVTGHTDTVQISPRSRRIFADNTALSFARAKSVGRYLTSALHLPPESLNLNGSGQYKPIATNRTAAGRALNRRVEVNVSIAQIIETTRVKITKERSGIKKLEVLGGAVKLPAESLSPPITPHLNDDTVSAQTASLIQTDQKKQDVPQKIAKEAPQNKGEHAVLISALNDAVIHHRIRMKGIKEPMQGGAVELVLPKNLLYMTGTTTLDGASVADPEVNGAILKYNFTKLPDEKKFDLKLQTLIDDEAQNSASGSSVTVTITDAAGKPVKTFTATSEISEGMDEINSIDLPPVDEQTLKKRVNLKDENEEYQENVVKTAPAAASVNTAALKPDTEPHITENSGILSPADGSIIVNQINAVRVILNSSLTAKLFLDGKEIFADRIGFSMKDNKTEKSLYTYIGVDFGEPGDHILLLKGVDTFGVTRFEKSAKISRAGEITSIRLVSADGNVADGKTPVRVKVQLFDRDNKLIAANTELSIKGGDLRPMAITGIGQGSTDAITVNNEGWINFQPVTNSGLYRTQLSHNKAVIDIETYVQPKLRDWILVGLAEGTVGYDTASGNMENLKESEVKEDFYQDGRVSFYAKGQIKGEWLLTMAYDTAKNQHDTRSSLFQQIDPDSYYTLYGDGTQQQYDAASSKKLYIRVERNQFYAMYGDYDTGLSVTELSRYSRRMTGAKTEYQGDHIEASGFAAESTQIYQRDEIPGDGTSGLYRLKRHPLVINSEKITIVTRDRFRSEVVISSTTLSRFIDYAIDYEAGTIFFKQPVMSKDENFNPITIVAEYEALSDVGHAYTYGGRVGVKLLDKKLKIGVSHIHEGLGEMNNDLFGVDTTILITDSTKLRGEAAETESNDNGVRTHGYSYLAELTKVSREFDGKAYIREQQGGFGLGQQMGSEAATRKYGLEGIYRLTESFSFSASLNRQTNLALSTERDVAEGKVSYTDKRYSTYLGLLHADDRLADRSSMSSGQITAGGKLLTLKERLTLSVDHAQSVWGNSNVDFPTRTMFGAEYKINAKVTLLGAQEFTWGKTARTNATRLGIRSTPWKGGTVTSTVERQLNENSSRVFSNMGLRQTWQLTDEWKIDAGLDRSQTISKKASYTVNPAVPPASGGAEDFTAVSTGANYLVKGLTWDSRFEYRTSGSEDKLGIRSGLVKEQGNGWAWSTRGQYLQTNASSGLETRFGNIRLGMVYRPPQTRWIHLDRFDVIHENLNGGGQSELTSWRLVNNYSANYRPVKELQISLKYGAKYVMDTINDKRYDVFTDHIGTEVRYDLTKKWDVGLRGSTLHTWNSGQLSYSGGGSVGYNMVENAWVSVGYNVWGFSDKDFSAADYTAQGPYIRFRIKFDQNSVRDAAKWLNKE